MTKIERWKPEKGERYWYISNVLMVAEDCWDGVSHLDEERYNAGNCFKTEEDAGIAAVKVKALLLSLPDKDNNQASNLPDKDLPDWCKVGEYVYDPLYGYGEIVFASEKHFYVEFDGHAAEYSQENVPELKQARLRQYTAAELRELVGTIIEETACGYGESSLLVTAYNSGVDSDAEPAVMMLGEWFGVNALCAGDYSVDGHICGVFEHLDAGEWVE